MPVLYSVQVYWRTRPSSVQRKVTEVLKKHEAEPKYILVILLSGSKQKSEEVAEGKVQNDTVVYFFFFFSSGNWRLNE